MRWMLALVLAACAPSPAPERIRATTPALAEPRLPAPGTGSLAPSLVHLVDAHPGAGRDLADVEGCATCHADVAPQWRQSAHAFASFNNPVYRVAVDRIRRERDRETSQFCGGCHDPSLLVDGAMLDDIAPTDLRAHAGITCNTCHGIANARADGNASYDLDLSPVPIPKDGDDESALRHRARVGNATLRTAAMCGTCHKAFLDASTGNAAHLIGQDDATPWSRSAFAGTDSARIDTPVKLADCRGCHMPRVPAVNGDPGAKNGTIASHWFLGSHTWLASMQNDPALVTRVQDFMKGRVSIDVGSVRPASPAPGDAVTVDVVVRNLDVGHRFPGGVMDAQDTWVDLAIDDANGVRIAEADDAEHTFASYMALEDGKRATVRETHEFRAGVFNHTIGPRDAAVVGYRFTAPRAAAYPLRVTARLRHRTRNVELQRAACDDYRSPRGQEFGRVGLAKVARAIDACKPQPISELASTSMTIGAPRPESFERSVAYGLGLSHGLQERLDDARIPYEAALSLARTPLERAIALGGLAQIASRQGRTDETFALAGQADALIGPTPAMQRARGDVLLSTWRMSEAAPMFLDVARMAPRDDTAWAAAAVAYAGAGETTRSLDAARAGLEAQPRDADMLRVQALALPTDAAAQTAFLERRTPDEAPSIRAKCSASVPGCALERIPVHTHAMRQAVLFEPRERVGDRGFDR